MSTGELQLELTALAHVDDAAIPGYAEARAVANIGLVRARDGAIDAHDPRIPLFLYMAFQDVHGPTEAPQRFLDLYPTTIHPARRRGLAQISAVDEAIGNLTGMLRAKGMWDASLFVFSADNGGPADHEPNFPLRGAKGADFEGGVRTVAFATGGRTH